MEDVLPALFGLLAFALSVAIIIGFFAIVSRLGVLVEQGKSQEALLRAILQASKKTPAASPVAGNRIHF